MGILRVRGVELKQCSHCPWACPGAGLLAGGQALGDTSPEHQGCVRVLGYPWYDPQLTGSSSSFSGGCLVPESNRVKSRGGCWRTEPVTQLHERETRVLPDRGGGRDSPSGGQFLIAPLESKTESRPGVSHAGMEVT